MTAWLLWAIVLGGPALGAVAGGIATHTAERIHWHHLRQTWHETGFDAGWLASRAQIGTMIPEMVFTQQGTLEPAEGGPDLWPGFDEAYEVAITAAVADFDPDRLRAPVP